MGVYSGCFRIGHIFSAIQPTKQGVVLVVRIKRNGKRDT